MVRIVCSGTKAFPHRKIQVYKTETPGWNMADASLSLRCWRCGQAPRPSGLTMRGLLLLARDAGGELDIGQRG